MRTGTPSRTALAAATHRAAHQLLEGGRIFSDPLAVRILGQDAAAVVREAEENPSRRFMRLFIAVRTRLAEDALAAAVDRGVSQLVVLGAGLDTFAYRNPFGSRLRVFEVDHPATQAWKRERLQEAAIPIPASLTFAPVDFERQTLAEGLAAAGFNATKQTFFTWLGVVPYLTEDAVWSTLVFLAGLPGGAHVVFDYSDPPGTLAAKARAYHDRHAARVESLGEAWVSYFEAEALRARLLSLGFSEVEDLGPAEIAARYFPRRAVEPGAKGGHILRASCFPADG
ncbi:MAG TPA: SAM-dependent methyltransferase [Patescibacteria group bacterium]|nr:SAM-dependent methyltransferase [Patescibacteria group bacterium]